MARTHADRGHMPPVSGVEQRLDTLLDLAEEIRDALRARPAPAASRHPGEVQLREPAQPAAEPPPPAEEGNEAYRAGRAAAAIGEPRSANPHDGRSREGRSWIRGWSDHQG